MTRARSTRHTTATKITPLCDHTMAATGATAAALIATCTMETNNGERERATRRTQCDQCAQSRTDAAIGVSSLTQSGRAMRSTLGGAAWAVNQLHATCFLRVTCSPQASQAQAASALVGSGRTSVARFSRLRACAGFEKPEVALPVDGVVVQLVIEQ